MTISLFSDNETPVFQNCPQQPIVVQKDANGGILPVNFTEPTAVDNSGSIARLEVKPASFRTPMYVFEDMVVKYVAYDYDGNVAICEINITVPGKSNKFHLISNENCVYYLFCRSYTTATELSPELRYRAGRQARQLCH